MKSTKNKLDLFQIAYIKIKGAAPSCGALMLGYLTMKVNSGDISVDEAILEAQMEETWNLHA